MKKKDEEKLNKDCHEDVQLPAKFKTHQSAFSEMLEELESMSDGHPGGINVSKYRINLLNSEVRPVDSTPYRAGLQQGYFAAAEIIRMLAEKIIQSALPIRLRQLY